MITKEQALAIAKSHLEKTKVPYTSLDNVEDLRFYPNKKIPYGQREGELKDVYSVGYGKIWGIEERTFGLYIDSETGEVLYSISPHGYF